MHGWATSQSLQGSLCTAVFPSSCQKQRKLALLRDLRLNQRAVPHAQSSCDTSTHAVLSGLLQLCTLISCWPARPAFSQCNDGQMAALNALPCFTMR